MAKQNKKLEPYNDGVHNVPKHMIEGKWVNISGVRTWKEPQVNDEDKKSYCLRSKRERILWGQHSAYKPCVLCDGVAIENADQLDNLVSKINAGVRVDECKKCWEAEDKGFYSFRKEGNKFWGTPGNGNSHTDIQYNNQCNAACIYCSRAQSSGWDDEIKNTKHKIPNGIGDGYVRQAKREDAEKVALDIIKNVANDHNKYACIGIYGGEPSLDIIENDHINLHLGHFFKHNKVWDRRVRYDFNSNMNFSDERCTEIIEYFKKCSFKFPTVDIIIQPSMECTGKYFHYTRYGNDWKQCSKNVKRFLEETEFKIEVKCKINNVSLKDWPSFVEYMNNLAKDTREYDLAVDFVTSPKWCSVEILDDSFKKYINDFWYYIENNPLYFRNQNVDDMVLQIKQLSELLGDHPEIAKANHAIMALEIHDYFKKERGTDLLEVNPELYYYFKMLKMSKN